MGRARSRDSLMSHDPSNSFQGNKRFIDPRAIVVDATRRLASRPIRRSSANDARVGNHVARSAREGAHRDERRDARSIRFIRKNLKILKTDGISPRELGDSRPGGGDDG